MVVDELASKDLSSPGSLGGAWALHEDFPSFKVYDTEVMGVMSLMKSNMWASYPPLPSSPKTDEEIPQVCQLHQLKQDKYKRSFILSHV
jgi:hypothetical protein